MRLGDGYGSCLNPLAGNTSRPYSISHKYIGHTSLVHCNDSNAVMTWRDEARKTSNSLAVTTLDTSFAPCVRARVVGVYAQGASRLILRYGHEQRISSKFRFSV